MTPKHDASIAVRLIAMAAWMTVAAACEEEEPPPTSTPAPAAKPAPKPAAAPAAPEPSEQKPPVTWAYSPVGKRDPFRSYLADLQASRERGERGKLEETERYELDQYRLTGLITGTAQPLAMVEDPTGKGHVLHIGSRLGKNGGRVTRISNRGIVVAEEFRAPTGERVRVPITINLPRPQLDLLQPRGR